MLLLFKKSGYSRLTLIFSLLFFTNFLTAQFNCPADVVTDTDPAECCVEVPFGEKQLLTTTAIPDITLYHPSSRTWHCGVAYNPIEDLYYQVPLAGGNATEGSTHDAQGNLLYGTTLPSLNFRALWWNPNTDGLEGNLFDLDQVKIANVDLDTDSYMSGTGSSILGPVGIPYFQLGYDYDYDLNQIVAYHQGQLHKYDMSGNFIEAIPVTGTPTGSYLNANLTGYSGVVGAEIMKYDHSNSRVFFYNKLTGEFAGLVNLPSSVGSYDTATYNVSFGNNRVWLYNNQTDTWYSYIITEDFDSPLGNTDGYTVVQNQGLPLDACFPVGTTMMEFEAMDDITGAVSTCSFSVTVSNPESVSLDTEASDLNLECDDANQQADINAWLATNGGASVTDICNMTQVTWSHDYFQGDENTSCGATGSVLVNFTADDNNGLMFTTSASITISDNVAPTIDVEAVDETIICDGTGNASEIQAWLNANGGAIASDVCSDVDWSHDYNPGDVLTDCSATASVLVTFTATDDCGNPSITSATLTIDLPQMSNNSAWVETVDIAEFTNTSGDDGGYGSFNMTVDLTVDGSHQVTLTPGYQGADERLYWRVYVDYNQDGNFHHGSERAVQVNGIGPVTKSLNVPPNALAGMTTLRVTMGVDGYVLPYANGFDGEIEDYLAELQACTEITDGGEISSTDYIYCPASNNPSQILGTSTMGIVEYIWMKNETQCIPTDGTEIDGWEFIPNAAGKNYTPGPLTTSAVYVRGVRSVGCVDYTFSNMIELSFKDDCTPDCTAEGLDSSAEYIFRFKFGGINNISGDDGGYGDYTNIVGNVSQGQNTTFQLRPRFVGGSHVVHWRVWVDWNQDGHFSDLCEIVAERSSNHTENGTYKIPADALPGMTKVRVAMKNSDYPESCETFALGEVEDYMINVNPSNFNSDIDPLDLFVTDSDSNNIDASANVDFDILPNPTYGELNMQFKNLQEENQVSILNSLGNTIATIDNVESYFTLNLKNFTSSPGVYFINLSSENNSMTKKIFLVE